MCVSVYICEGVCARQKAECVWCVGIVCFVLRFGALDSCVVLHSCLLWCLCVVFLFGVLSEGIVAHCGCVKCFMCVGCCVACSVPCRALSCML